MNRLFGHDQAVAAFMTALGSGRMHHAWLLSGPTGVGKALFADKAALRLLAGDEGNGFDVADDHSAARLVDAGSHPDLARLERLPRESGGDLARNISVAQVRGLQRLFATTASIAPWRVVVIDSIDDMAREAANALLKNLEEPPANTVFLLVSHAPERLLPTIRSRCRTVRFTPLQDDVMAPALRQALPDADDAEIAGLLAAGNGSPGRALALRGLDMHALEATMRSLARDGDPFNAGRSKLAAALSPKSAQPRYEAFLARVPSVIAEYARDRRGPALADALRLWERATDLAGSATRLSLDPQSTVFELAGLLAALAPAKAHG